MLTLKSHKTLSVLAACILPAAIYSLAVPVPVFRYIVPLFVCLVVIIEGVSWTTLTGAVDGKRWSLLRSSLFYIAWLCLFFLMPTQNMQMAYMIVSVPILYLGQQLIAYTGETVLVTHTILTSFGILLAAAAGEFYFHAGSVVLTLVVFVCLFLLTRATYVFVPQTSTVRLASSLLVAFLATEVYASVLFLPFHYTVLGFCAFLVFYVLWLFTYYWQFGALTPQRVKLYLLVSAALLTALLLATPWQIMT